MCIYIYMYIYILYILYIYDIYIWYCVLATSGDSLEYPHNHFWPLESVMVLWGFIQVPSWSDFTQQFVAINLFNYHIIKPRLRMDEYLLQYITIWIHIIMDLCAHLEFLTKIRSWQKLMNSTHQHSDVTNTTWIMEDRPVLHQAFSQQGAPDALNENTTWLSETQLPRMSWMNTWYTHRYSRLIQAIACLCRGLWPRVSLESKAVSSIGWS